MKKLSAAVVMAIFLTASSGGIFLTAAAGPQVLTPFPLSSVRLANNGGLGTSPFYISFNSKILQWLLQLDINRMAYIWRSGYGLPTGGAASMGCWEAPSCALRGHMTGHVLSSLAMAYALSGNTTILGKTQYFLRILDTCQNRATSQGRNLGCLSAYGEGQFDALQAGGAYSSTLWAPWYTQHKILGGLLRCYEDMGDTLALHIAKAMGSWAYNRLHAVTQSRLDAMWATYIAGETGSYGEEAAKLYQITGDTTYRRLAIFLDDHTSSGASLNNLINNTDNISASHANQYTPRFISYLKNYDITGTATYFSAADNLFNMVDIHHSFRNGGINANSSNGENFMPRDGEVANHNGNYCESCPSYNWMKLGKYLYYHDPVTPKYFDFSDRIAFNRMLHVFNVVGSPASYTTWSQYMSPVSDNTGAGVDGQDLGGGGFTCCGGTCLEAPMRFAEGIYAYRGDTLFINTFIPSTLTWSAKNLTVAMATNFPESDVVTLTITVNSATATMPVKIRAPWWKRRAWTISIDGAATDAVTTRANNWQIAPTSVFRLSTTTWTVGTHTIVITVPQTPRFELGSGSSTVGCIMFGPLCMTRSGTGSINASTWSRPSATSANLTIGGTAFVPWYRPTAAFTTYMAVTNIPSTWTDTTWEVRVSVSNSGTPANAVMTGPTVELVKSQIHVSFNSAAGSDQTLRVQLFNARGAMVSDLKGTLQKGSRSVMFSQPKGMLASGMYVASVTAGERNFRTSLVCER